MRRGQTAENQGEMNASNDALRCWWSTPRGDVIQRLGVDVTKGLSPERIDGRRRSFGSNVLKEIKPTGVRELILDGVKEPMMVLLPSIAPLSLLFGKPAEVASDGSRVVTWLLGHIMLALNPKQEKLPLLRQGLFANRFGALWLAGMVVLSVVITTVQFVRPDLHTSPCHPRCGS